MREKVCEQRLVTKPSESASQDALPSSYGTFKLQKPRALRKSRCLQRHKRCPHSLMSGRFQSTYDSICQTSPCDKGEMQQEACPRVPKLTSGVPPIPVHSPPKKSSRLLTSEPGVLLENRTLNPGFQGDRCPFTPTQLHPTDPFPQAKAICSIPKSPTPRSTSGTNTTIQGS